MYGIQMATFYVRRSYKRYGPISIPEPTSFLTNRQQYILYTRHQLTATVKYRAFSGIWVGSLCMRQCRYALAIGRGVFLPIDISRCTSRRMSNNQSDRRGVTRHVDYFRGRCPGEAPGHLRYGC